MFLGAAATSLFYPPIKPSFVTKYFTKTNLHFAANHPTKMSAISRKNEQTHSFFTSCCHPPTSELKAAAAAAVDSQDGHTGIGILEFFQGKNIFVTGATGLLGKVVVEKLLRSTSMGKIYLLVKAKDKEAAFDRLQSEIISSELFASVKEKYGTSYIGLVKEKLIPIVGDICKPNMGMDSESIDAVRKDVHVIIHSAASTTFNERYDLLVDSNVIAPQRLMRFAKTCNKLQLFTHISTAYVNERREGIISEESMIMGGDDGVVDVANEISLLLKSSPNNNDATNYFRKLGRQRAEMLGWSTTYQLSKAMGEMCLNEIRGDVPLLIIRPSIIESCYNEPLPGWIQGMRMCDPIIIRYGRGQLPAFVANPQAPMDLIPVDLAANTVIAAIAKCGNMDMQEAVVYHVASSHSNPITLSDFFEYLHQYFKAAPLRGERPEIAKIKIFENFDEFSKCTREEILGVGEDGNKSIRECNAKAEFIEQLCKTYEFVVFSKARFHTGNTHKLIEEMSKVEQLKFEVDVKNINWKKYLQEIHIPGLIKSIYMQ
ncbi:fatty acyl-CoA reductase 2, chloroplastic-like [Salvia miltiorrhiza]|uniref:fatty acyl-CoA reductase 2, chloroplastic-like n=1 Tax=Salvia miltiorrhiza TaxID=226208 RepID=UPI0025AD6917|nr:fatty acyl-CoA reductase 2, chloroplastic-like [Salvia miltiorrhiza]